VHAREYITAPLVLKLFEDYSYEGARLDLVPLLNIDGALLSRNGIESLKLNAFRKEFLMRVNQKEDFSLWKANINAVDINLNFDAGFGEGEGNLTYPSSQGYIGRCPESEPETKAAANLMRNGSYDAVIAYHTKGEEVYFGFRDDLSHKNEALLFAKSLGYALKETPNSAGGLKDYFVLKTKRFGLTIEAGSDALAHPIKEDELPNLIDRHKGSFNLLGEIVSNLKIPP
jgi:g-D-glutamyl-meso-diaminopimelate peptidase